MQIHVNSEDKGINLIAVTLTPHPHPLIHPKNNPHPTSLKQSA